VIEYIFFAKVLETFFFISSIKTYNFSAFFGGFFKQIEEALININAKSEESLSLTIQQSSANTRNANI
jgi:hypothetical protein